MTAWERLLAWEDSHRFVVDATGTALVALVLVPLSATTLGVDPYPAGRGGMLVTFLALLPLAWRRVRPVASAAAVYTVVLLQMLLVTPLLFPTDLVVLVALYSVTVHGPRWAHRLAMAGVVAGAALLVGLSVDSLQWAAAVFLAAFAVAVGLSVWAFGLVRRSRRETLEALVDRAERLEVERDQQALIATSAERARIAREMHDIVAHSLSVMIAQADGGRYAAQADPPAATRALETISETGRAALTDMRRLLGVLREQPGDHAQPRPGVLPNGDTAPQPAEGDIEQLVEHVRSSGAHVSLVRMGTPRSLPPGVGLTVYRIAQESLTNVLKHAGPRPDVTVLVQWLPDAISLEVTDDGRGAAAGSDGQGSGLRGMGERAALFGGTVTAGPRPGGGFRVRAHLPAPGDAYRGTDEPGPRADEEER